LKTTASEEHNDLREALRGLCAKFPAEYHRKHGADQSYPEEFIDALTKAGWLSAMIPEEYGGSGLPVRGGAVILETINATGCNASPGHAQMYTMGTILRHGSKEQKERFLPKIASGELRLQAFGVTEPTSGSDTTRIETRAEKRGNGYVINGQKVWTSRAAHSDLMLLLARTTPYDQVDKKTHGISTFLIDLNEAQKNGCTITPIKAMINHNTCEVFFDNVPIPGDALIGEEGKGFRYILDGLNAERTLIAAECIGDGYWFIEKANADECPSGMPYIEKLVELSSVFKEIGNPVSNRSELKSKVITSAELVLKLSSTIPVFALFKFERELGVLFAEKELLNNGASFWAYQKSNRQPNSEPKPP